MREIANLAELKSLVGQDAGVSSDQGERDRLPQKGRHGHAVSIHVLPPFAECVAVGRARGFLGKDLLHVEIHDGLDVVVIPRHPTTLGKVLLALVLVRPEIRAIGEAASMHIGA